MSPGPDKSFNKVGLFDAQPLKLFVQCPLFFCCYGISQGAYGASLKHKRMRIGTVVQSFAAKAIACKEAKGSTLQPITCLLDFCHKRKYHIIYFLGFFQRRHVAGIPDKV